MQGDVCEMRQRCEGDAKEMREEMGASLYLGTLHKEREIGERLAQHDLDEEQEDEEEGSDGTRGAVDLRGRCREMQGVARGYEEERKEESEARVPW